MASTLLLLFLRSRYIWIVQGSASLLQLWTTQNCPRCLIHTYPSNLKGKATKGLKKKHARYAKRRLSRAVKALVAIATQILFQKAAKVYVPSVAAAKLIMINLCMLKAAGLLKIHAHLCDLFYYTKIPRMLWIKYFERNIFTSAQRLCNFFFLLVNTKVMQLVNRFEYNFTDGHSGSGFCWGASVLKYFIMGFLYLPLILLELLLLEQLPMTSYTFSFWYIL